MRLQDIKKLTDYEWEIPQTFKPGMLVPVRIFASRKLLEDVMGDSSLEQAVNAAMLPGLVGRVIVMPDMHQGYGFPIGGVAATRFPEGVISPGAIGYDINCGVRLLATNIALEDAAPWLEDLAGALDHYCPSGVGVSGHLNLTEKELDNVCEQGSYWAKKKGYATDNDLTRTEEWGRIDGAYPGDVSPRAKARGRSQLGTLGAGNHFIEVDMVDRIEDPLSAGVMGLSERSLVVQIHCGSRGFGHQICSDYVRDFQSAVHRYGIRLPDRELVCAPMDSPEGRAYLSAMRCAANFAFANRQVLAHFARRAFEEVFAGKVPDWQVKQVYDIAHNMGKIETHVVDGEAVQVCVHRKGATRAFGPGAKELPEIYREIGQPVLVPGSMGTASWVLAGTKGSMEKSFGSTCHGAGRVMSRRQAKKMVRGNILQNNLEKQGIMIRAGSLAGLAEEAPQAYKDVDQVIQIVSSAGIAKKVARLTPVVVIKG